MKLMRHSAQHGIGQLQYTRWPRPSEDETWAHQTGATLTEGWIWRQPKYPQRALGEIISVSVSVHRRIELKLNLFSTLEEFVAQNPACQEYNESKAWQWRGNLNWSWSQTIWGETRGWSSMKINNWIYLRCCQIPWQQGKVLKSKPNWREKEMLNDVENDIEILVMRRVTLSYQCQEEEMRSRVWRTRGQEEERKGGRVAKPKKRGVEGFFRPDKKIAGNNLCHVV